MTILFRFAAITLALLGAPMVFGTPSVVTSPGSVAPAFGATITLAANVTVDPPATYVWTRDGTPILDGGRYSGAFTTALSITGVNNTDNGSYTLTATDTLGSAATTPASVTVTQSEADRDPATTNLSSDSTVGAILHLPDGRTLIGGNLNGAGSTTAHSRLAIVGTNYQVTPTPLGLFNGTPSSLVRQPDGKILVLGASTEIGGISGVGRTYLSRLNADLTLDTSFLPPVPNNITTSAVLDAQGRIYLGGNFTNLGGGNDGRYSYLVRLLPDGRLDSSFSILLNGNVTDLVMQADGKIIVGGTFQAYGPTETFTLVQSLIRLNADGSYDSGFTANYAPSEAYGTGIKDLALDSQQRLLIASFHLGSTATPYGIYRLLPSGAKDPTFAFSEPLSNYALAIRPVADDKLLVAGNFTTPVRKFFRLDNTGTRDAAFTTGLGTGFAADSSYIQTLAPDALGRLWLGGDFTSFKSTTVNRLLVLQGQAPTLAFSAQPLARSIDIGGTATFTAAATGNNGFTFQWLKNGTPLGDGGRISGATTATLTITGLIATDAADYTVAVTSPSGASTFTSITSSAAPLVVLAAPEIITPPYPLTRDLGGSATFSAAARGAGTLSYQWLLGTIALGNGTVGGVTIAGATTPTLTISGITFTQAGGYSLRVTNTLNPTTSAAALLTIQRRPEALAAGLVQPSFSGGDVHIIRPLADGTTLVGGAFTSVTINGVTTPRNRLVHLLADGTLDTTFVPSFDNTVRALEVDSAGRVFVGGDFTSITFGATTTNRTRVARLTAALALDSAFDTATAGPNGTVRALAPVGDGSVYVGGLFTQIGAVATSAVSRLVLLNAAGALDSSFTSYATGDIHSLVRLPDGTLYAASLGATWNSPGVTGSPSGSLIKLSATGARDTAFAPPALVLNYFAPSIQLIQLLTDGTLLAAGYGTSPQAYLRRFHATTGAELTNYSVGHTATVFAIAQQADGKILSGSNPVLSRAALAGTADAAFNVGSGFNNAIRTLAVDGSNRIWIGGAFTTYNGTTANRLTILNGGDFESQSGPLTPQTITFPALADKSTADTPFLLAATSDSGLPVAYAITGPATLSGSTVTLTGATGTVTITATQTGNATTAAATPFIRSFSVTDPLADFLTAAGVPANLRGPNDDSDNDGFDNLLEYALDLNPNGSGGAFTGTPPASSATPTQLSYTYRRVRNDVTYVVESSADLASGSWTSVGVTQGTPAGDGTTTASIPITPGSQFLRLSVSR